MQDQTVIIDAGGELRNVRLLRVAAVAARSASVTSGVTGSTHAPAVPPDGTGCLQPPPLNNDFPVVPRHEVATRPLYARMGYTSDSPGKVWVIPSSAGIGASTVTPVDVAVGTHEVLVPLLLDEIHGMPQDGMPVAALQVSPLTGNSFCITSLSVVTPVIADPDGSCWNMDRYGTPTEVRRSCPK